MLPIVKMEKQEALHLEVLLNKEMESLNLQQLLRMLVLVSAMQHKATLSLGQWEQKVSTITSLT